MPKTLADTLGSEGREAVLRHRDDETRGVDDGKTLPTPHADLRALATLLSVLQHDTPERANLLKLAKVESISPRHCIVLGNEILREVDNTHASALFALPWDKAPYPSRDEAPPNRGLNTVRLSSVIPVDVDWLWSQRIPVGKLTIISGDPDLGKTWVVLDVACRISTGRTFPDVRNTLGTRRDTLWMSAEDDDADTVRPRIDTLGGDATRIHSLQFVREEKKEHTFKLAAHLEMLGDWLRINPVVSLVVLDPFAAFLGKIDSHRNSDVRALLTPLAKLAAKHQVAIVGINHLCKGDGDKAIYRSNGSIAFVAAARSSWLVTADPKERDRRLFTKVKGNLQSQDVGGLAYRIGPHIPGVLMWEPDAISTTADETLRVLAGENNQAPARAEAKAWLRELLKAGPMVASEIWAQAKADGMAVRTVKDAKKELGIRTDKVGGQGTPWMWSLPTK